ncbi:hypothetical protein WMY93_002161 [Mugilogobius chulae]|uniref:Integrin alpha-2 domain-containing protein n=1 Tax=Mugilogobius chulae TaxID=88201 RepID=A0AAW0PV18_9GOBI
MGRNHVCQLVFRKPVSGSSTSLPGLHELWKTGLNRIWFSWLHVIALTVRSRGCVLSSETHSLEKKHTHRLETAWRRHTHTDWRQRGEETHTQTGDSVEKRHTHRLETAWRRDTQTGDSVKKRHTHTDWRQRGEETHTHTDWRQREEETHTQTGDSVEKRHTHRLETAWRRDTHTDWRQRGEETHTHRLETAWRRDTHTQTGDSVEKTHTHRLETAWRRDTHTHRLETAWRRDTHTQTGDSVEKRHTDWRQRGEETHILKTVCRRDTHTIWIQSEEKTQFGEERPQSGGERHTQPGDSLEKSSQVCAYGSLMADSSLVLWSMLLSACVAFNLDPLVSVVKTGTQSSLFGFSVALHQDTTTGGYRLLVGAPREKAELGVSANRTGGVYLCPISSDPWNCSRVPLIDPEQLVSEDLIEDMWLGVSVASQGPPGGRVLTCGHRFAKLYGAYRLRHMTGRCFVRGNDLQYNDSDAHWQNPDQVCSHLGEVSAEVMCTMGVSADISQKEIVVGSPGSFDWQGYSVALAPRLLSQHLDSIITGAPKDSKQDARGSVFLALKSRSGLQILQRLRGEQMGSYYGNAVAVLDFNNDGWNDLLVGAPFFFQRQQEVGGAVYVYLNTGGRFDSRPTLVLKGPQSSAFGMALCAAGDLDQDGFQDFVVGAPFHGTGSVMIYNSGPSGVPQRPSQVIQGSSISPLFRTFGFSLAPARDVDENQHPDLLIGSLDDSVVLLRSRPVLELTQTLHVSPDVVDPSDCGNCIRVKVCFSYTFRSGQNSDKDNITVQFSVSADVSSLKPRVRFSSNRKSHVLSHLSMPQAHCSTLRAGLLTPIRDQVQPLVFSLKASLFQKLPKNCTGLEDLRVFPVISSPLPLLRHQIHIQKACGNDNRCHSNLQMTAQFTDETYRPLDIWLPQPPRQQVPCYLYHYITHCHGSIKISDRTFGLIYKMVMVMFIKDNVQLHKVQLYAQELSHPPLLSLLFSLCLSSLSLSLSFSSLTFSLSLSLSLSLAGDPGQQYLTSLQDFRLFSGSCSDVDENQHPDLLIGSLDDSVVLLRFRPVLELTQTLHVSPDVVDPSDCRTGQNTRTIETSRIRVKVCFSYTFRSGQNSDKDNITVQFSVRADVSSLKPRVVSQQQKSHVLSHLSMPSPLQHTESRTLIHIQEGVWNDNRCHSNLQMTAQFTDETYRPLDIVAEGRQRLVLDSSLNLLLLHVNVTNLPSPWKPFNHTQEVSSPWRPLDNSYSALSPWRVAEDAHSVSLNVSIPASLVYSGVRAKISAWPSLIFSRWSELDPGAFEAVECAVEAGALLCDLGNPLKANHQVEVWIRFQPSEASLRSREITSQLQLSTLSEQWDLFLSQCLCWWKCRCRPLSLLVEESRTPGGNERKCSLRPES